MPSVPPVRLLMPLLPSTPFRTDLRFVNTRCKGQWNESWVQRLWHCGDSRCSLQMYWKHCCVVSSSASQQLFVYFNVWNMKYYVLVFIDCVAQFVFIWTFSTLFSVNRGNGFLFKYLFFVLHFTPFNSADLRSVMLSVQCCFFFWLAFTCQDSVCFICGLCVFTSYLKAPLFCITGEISHKLSLILNCSSHLIQISHVCVSLKWCRSC